MTGFAFRRASYRFHSGLASGKPISLRPMRFSAPQTALTLGAVIVGLTSACGGGKPAATDVPNPDAHPLSGIAGQPLLIAPVQSVRIAPELAWSGGPRPASIMASLDSALSDTLRARVSNQQWVYAPALVQSFTNNPTYATDPRALSVNVLRAAKLKIDERLIEPLASQLRTMIALHEGRLVLIPVELRFDRTAAGLAHPVVRLVLVDPRASVIRWYADVTGVDTPAFAPDYAAVIGSRVADLFVPK
jgi:hypothetical protein